MLRLAAAIALVAVVALAAWRVAGAQELGNGGNGGGNGGGDANQGHGLRLEIEETEDLPKGDSWKQAFHPRDVDFGKDLDPKNARSYEVWLTYAVAKDPAAKSELEKGWTPLEPQRAGLLRGVSLSSKQAVGREPGFYVALYRPKMDEAALKAARKLGESAKILLVDIRETRRRSDGAFENDAVMKDPSPALVRKVGSVYVDGGTEVFLYVKPIHPDSKEGQKLTEEEAKGSGRKKSDFRSYRAHLEIMNQRHRKDDGSYAEPDELPKAADDVGGKK